MKIFGIVLLVFAALNFIVAILAASNGAADAAGQKMSAGFLLSIIGGLLFYFGKQKDKRKIEEVLDKKKEEELKVQCIAEEKQRIETAKKTEEGKKRREIEANSKKYKITRWRN